MALKVTTFQNRFSSLFDESKKTTVELARELHVSNQTISAWKTGARSPKEPMLILIARYFGVSVEWLMGFNVEKEQSVKELLTNEFNEYYKEHGYPEVPAPPRTSEARIISGGIDKMPKERREQALKILQVAFAEFSDLFKEEPNDDT